MTSQDAIIYLRLSDFRDENDTTFTAREDELRVFAADLHLNVVRVAVENDVNGNAKTRGASAYKTPVKVHTSSGLITFRTKRPVFQDVVLDLQRGVAGVLIVSDDSRISRNHRDGDDLLDACKVSGASAVAPDDEGNPRWILTRGGTHAEISAFQDRIHDARKYSDDVAVKVRKGRRRWAGKSYQGGRRPFGYRHVQGTQEHERTLTVDPAEAEVLRNAATDILHGVSLASIARGLRTTGVPTVTGTAWTASTLRDTLSKPAVAGLAVYREVLRDAPWEPILERDTWERLCDMFNSRKTGRSPAPRWLISCYATCGKCGGPTRVTGTKTRRSYTCTDHGHFKRAAEQVDEYVNMVMVERLSRDDAADLLKPPPSSGVDGKALRSEAKRIAERKAALARVFAATGDEQALSAGLRVLREREEEIGRQLSVTDVPDPLEDFRGRPADVVWESLSLPRRREVVKLLTTSITFGPLGDNKPFGVAITWA